MISYSFFSFYIMHIILSPAKIQNFKPQLYNFEPTLPAYLKEANTLIQLIKQLSTSELSKLLQINSKLTQINIDRYLHWHLPFSAENAKPAALVFDGEVFRGLNFQTLTPEQSLYAGEKLTILSGLYGCLRPTDLIQPYRLEVSSALAYKNGKDLYAFWKNKITKFIQNQMKASDDKDKILLNLASSEYFKSIDTKKLKCRIIDIEFYEFKDDQFKQIVIYTKKARGLMARYVLENQISDPELLKGFNSGGYWYHPEMSNENKYSFVR